MAACTQNSTFKAKQEEQALLTMGKQSQAKELRLEVLTENFSGKENHDLQLGMTFPRSGSPRI